MNWLEIPGRSLAYLGDAEWSLLVRKYLVVNGAGKGGKLQNKTIAYVSAKAQAHFYDVMHEEGFLSEEEESAFLRGRNDHAGTVPKSASVSEYRKSTGFEAMIGMLEICEKKDRLNEILLRATHILSEETCHN